MIQRIQTVYLLIVVVLQTILFFSPIADYIVGADQNTYKITSDFLLASLTLITAVTAFASIFMYGKRTLQIRVNVFNIILLLVLQGLIAYYSAKIHVSYEAVSFSVPVVFPIISAILTLAAIRSIIKDELLIKTLNRIR